jgi:hypothetical protein
MPSCANMARSVRNTDVKNTDVRLLAICLVQSHVQANSARLFAAQPSASFLS